MTTSDAQAVCDAEDLKAKRIEKAAPELLKALKNQNHMGGDARGGYCICPLNDGSAPDEQHSTSCAEARQAIAKVEGKTS